MTEDLDCECNKFYLHGRYFDKEEEFWEFAKSWPLQKVDEDSMDELFHGFKRNVQINMGVYMPEITNGELSEMLHESFLQFMKNLPPFKND